MRRKIHTLTSILLTWTSLALCQSNEVSLIGTGGNTITSGNIILSYSFGEVINTFQNNDNHWLTQGFQQPGKIFITSTSDVYEKIEILMTPNPATNDFSA